MFFLHVIPSAGCEHEHDANVFSPATHSIEATWRWRLKLLTKLYLSWSECTIKFTKFIN